MEKHSATNIPAQNVTVVQGHHDPESQLPESAVIPVNPQLDQFNAPPPGAPQGGIWGTGKYVGGNTHGLAAAVCCCISCFGLFLLCFKLDERDLYMVNNQIYNMNGEMLGGPGQVDFMPNPPDRQHLRKGVSKSQVEETCGPHYARNIWGCIGCWTCCILILVIVYVVFVSIVMAPVYSESYGYNEPQITYGTYGN